MSTSTAARAGIAAGRPDRPSHTTRSLTMTDQPARYRRRPAEIEAVQWLDTNTAALEAFAGHRFITVDPEDRIDDPDATASLRESAHECWSLLRPGDWVVKRGDDFAVLTGEEFTDLYEPVPVSCAAPGQTALRGRVAEALRSITAIGDTPPRLIAPVVAGENPRMVRIVDWQPLDALLDAVLSVLPPPADRATVLREAAEALDQFLRENPPSPVTAGGWRGAWAWLRRLAAEAQPEPETGGALKAAHVALAEQAGRDQAALTRVRTVLETESVLSRSALDYRGLILTALMDAEAQPKADATFFQPGHTYTCLSDSAVQWTFKVAAVAESPAGDLAALGFLKGANFGTGVWTPHGELDFNGWTDAAAEQDGAQQA